MRWAIISQLTRSVSRLSVFSVALSNLLVRAEELGITPEDRAHIQNLLLKISQYLFSQASRSSTAVFRERRQLAFNKLGFDKQADGSFVESLPFHGPFLFAGKLLDSVDQQISMHKRAAALASQVRSSRVGARRNPYVPPFRGDTAGRRRGVRRSSSTFRGHRFSLNSRSRFVGTRGQGRGSSASFHRPSSS